MALSLYMQYDSEWSPACDVCENADCIQLIADLPGMARDSLKVGIEDGLLVISGERERRRSSIEGGGRYHAAERGQGKFKKLLTLPKGDALRLEGLDYQLSEGVLLVTIPKKQ
jgi:HSP20 family protein